MEANEEVTPSGRDGRYSAPLDALVYEISNCQALADSLATLIEQAEDGIDRARRVAEALSEKLGVLAAKVDELETHGPRS